jgi:hypothetical protein
MLTTILTTTLLLTPDADAGDRGACRKARREVTVEAWTKYVLDHPEGRCGDEAIGQLLVLNIGRFAVEAGKGDRTKIALALAQLGRTDMEDLSQLSSLLGGSGLGGFGGGGVSDLWGGSGYDDYTYDNYGDYGGMLGTLGTGYDDYAGDQTIYVSYYVDQVDGSWNEDRFWTALDGTTPKLQQCWKDLGRDPMGIYYVVGFGIDSGAATVTSITQDYSEDGRQHEDVEGCVRDSLQGATFPSDVTGTYSYRIELY